MCCNQIRPLIMLAGVIAFLLVACNDLVETDENPYRQEHIDWPSLADAPWPMARHDPQGTGRSQYMGPKYATSLKEIGHEGEFTFCSPLIGPNNEIYTLVSESHMDRLYKYMNPDSVLWVFEFPGHYQNPWTPVLAANNVVIVCSQLDILYAISDINGEVLWSTSLGKTIESNAILDKEGNIFLNVGDDRTLVSLTPDGSLRWEYTGVRDSGWEIGAISPNGDQIYVQNFAMDSLLSISTEEGNKQWAYPTGGQIGWIVVDNAGNVYIFTVRNIKCITEDGMLRWYANVTDFGMRGLKIDVAPTIDRDGKLYWSGSSEVGDAVLISFDNEGNFRWISSEFGITDLTCDYSDGIFAGKLQPGNENEDYVIQRITSMGNLEWELVYPNVGLGTVGFSIAIGNEWDIVLPLMNSSSVQYLQVMQ